MKTQINRKAFSLFVLFIILFSCNAFAQGNDNPTMTKTFEMDRPGSLLASSSGGGVEVKTHNDKTVEVQMFVRKNGKVLSPSDSQVKEILEKYDVTIEKNGAEITAIVKNKLRNNFINNTGISLKIIVPQEMSCDVSSSGGGVKISGVKGTHSFSSSGGGVHIENVTGTTKARSSGGGVDVKNQNGDVDLSSSGGGVSLEEARGNVIARSSGGGVHLTNIRGNIDAGSSGGGVYVSGEAGAVKAKSSGGPVKVNITNLKKELYLESSGGSVNAVIQGGEKLGLDLDLSSDKVNIELHNFSGKSEKNRIKGTMNGGGIPVYMRSSGGNVNVSFQD